MKEGAQHTSRRSVLAGLAALALSGTEVVSQEQQDTTPERFSATIEPRTIQRRSDTFRIYYQTPVVTIPENTGIAQHIDVFACVLQRDATGAPLQTIRKNIAFSRNAVGTFTLSPSEFLEADEQLVELSVRAESDHTELTQLFGTVQLPFSITSEPSIPEGYSCTPKQVS